MIDKVDCMKDNMVNLICGSNFDQGSLESLLVSEKCPIETKKFSNKKEVDQSLGLTSYHTCQNLDTSPIKLEKLCFECA